MWTDKTDEQTLKKMNTELIYTTSLLHHEPSFERLFHAFKEKSKLHSNCMWVFNTNWCAVKWIIHSGERSGKNSQLGHERQKKVFRILVRVNHAVIHIQSSTSIWFVSIMSRIDRITWRGICQDVTPAHTHTWMHTHTHADGCYPTDGDNVSAQEGVIAPSSVLRLSFCRFVPSLPSFSGRH